MKREGEPATTRGGWRSGGMLLALSFGVGVTGFQIATGVELGTETPSSRSDTRHLDSAGEASANLEAGGVVAARPYLEITPLALAASAGQQPGLHRGLTPERLVEFYGSAPASSSERAATLERRAQRRAYAGAPPVVPHAIDQLGTQACTVCHAEGMQVGNVVAPAMSHGYLANCTQCHVEARGALPLEWGEAELLSMGSLFQGQSEPGAGSRAWQGAPPTIPHSTWMRSACITCHASEVGAGLQTSHPWRTSCTQCHAPSADLDQMPVRTSPWVELR